MVLDFIKSPEGQGLLSMIAGGMAGARRGEPWNTAGRAGIAGLTGYAGAQDRAKASQDAINAKELRDLQLGEMRAKVTEREKLAEWQQNIPMLGATLGQEATQDQPAMPAQFGFGGRQFPTEELAAQERYGSIMGGAQDTPVTRTGPTGFVPGTPAVAPQPRRVDVQAMPSYAMQPGSPHAGKAFEQMIAPQKREAFKPGDYIPDGKGGYTQFPEKAVPVDHNKPFNADGTPNLAYQDYSLKGKKAGATQVHVGGPNMGKQETKQSEAYGTGLGEWRTQIQNTGFKAHTWVNNLARSEQLLEGIDSGKLAGAGMEVSRLAKSFGVTLDPKLGNKEASEALTIAMALSMKEPGTGPMTDKDFENFLATVPSLSKTAEGRKQVTITLRAKANRDIEVAKMTRDYAKKNNGVIDDEFLNQVSIYMAQNPLVSKGGGNLTYSDAAEEKRYQAYKARQP